MTKIHIHELSSNALRDLFSRAEEDESKDDVGFGVDDQDEVIEKDPGILLRVHVRGFLHSHLGYSKLAAHHLADVFMEDWLAQDADLLARYSEESRLTKEATFNRLAIQEVDRNLGVSRDEKLSMMDVVDEVR